MAATPIFQTLGGALDNATATFVTDTVNRLIDTITPWALAGITLYLTLYGYMILAGRIQEPVQDGLIKAGKIIIISALALNADTYLTWVVDTLKGLQTSMTVAVTGQEGATIYQSLDETLDSGMNLFNQCVLRALDAGWTEMGTMISWFMVAALLMVSFFWVVVIGGAAIVIASGLLKLVFAVGPFFIVSLMFPATAHLFEKWLGKALTYILQIIMVAAMMTIAVKVFEYALGYVDFSQQSEQSALKVGLVFVAIGLILYRLSGETGKLAGELGGGLAVEMLSAAGMAHTTLAPARAAKQLVTPTSTRLDPTTGHRTTASRLEHLAAGRTVAAPVYRQVVLEHMRNGWKKPNGGTIQRD